MDKVSGISISDFMVNMRKQRKFNVDFSIFRWKESNDGSYIGVMANCVWQLQQTDDQLLYRVLGELKTMEFDKYFNEVRIKVPVQKKSTLDKKSKKKIASETGFQPGYTAEYYESLLRAYFRLDINLSDCYDKWSLAHSHFASEAGKFYAIRVLDQDPVENLFSFICSQNNHISRCVLYINYIKK